jgi:chromosome partitioning protein
MLAYTVFGEAGGPGKTTLTASLAAAHAQRGWNVLAIDLDPQDASLSYLLDVDDDRADPDADHLVRHLIGQPKGPLLDIIRKTEYGVDVIPAHNALSNLGDLLDRRAANAEDMGESFNPTTRLREVLVEANISDHYDVVICDPAATEGQGLYNALAATGHLVIPVEATAKGRQSIDGLEQLADGLEAELGIELAVLAVVPNKVDLRSGTQRRYVGEIDTVEYAVPEQIPIRGALFDGAWEHQCTPQAFVEEHRENAQEREVDTLETIGRLAAALEREVGLE